MSYKPNAYNPRPVVSLECSLLAVSFHSGLLAVSFHFGLLAVSFPSGVLAVSCFFFFPCLAPQHSTTFGGGHWGLLNTALPLKNSTNTAIPQKKKSENTAVL